MEMNKKQQELKKPYIKPQIEEIQLVAEEAVLSVCKDQAAGMSCMPDPCTDAGDFAS